MTPQELASIETAWGVKLPPRFTELGARDFDALHLPDHTTLNVPWPTLTANELVHACNMAHDWDIPTGLLPIIGDFHNLICLDYRDGGEPRIVMLNDARSVTPLFSSFASFVNARFLKDATVASNDSGVIDAESWLAF